MIRRFSVNFAIFSMVLDGISVMFCLWFAAAIRPFMSNISFFQTIDSPVIVPYPLYILFPVIWVVIFASLSIYDGRKFLRAADELAILMLATFIASISTAGILYFSFREVSRALYVVFVISTFLMCLFWRVLARTYFRLNPESSKASRRLAVVGVGPLGQSVGMQIQNTHSESLSLVGYVDDGYASQNGIRCLGRVEELRALIRKYQITDIVLALPYSEYHKMSEIVQYLEDSPVGVWVALGFFDLALYRTDIENFAGIPMLDLRASAIDDYQRMMKRAFDLFFSLFALMPALPLLALSALIVFLEDGAPILFRQPRVGENGRTFEMLKFRTMVKNAEQLQGLVEKSDLDGNRIYKAK